MSYPPPPPPLAAIQTYLSWSHACSPCIYWSLASAPQQFPCIIDCGVRAQHDMYCARTWCTRSRSEVSRVCCARTYMDSVCARGHKVARLFEYMCCYSINNLMIRASWYLQRSLKMSFKNSYECQKANFDADFQYIYKKVQRSSASILRFFIVNRYQNLWEKIFFMSNEQKTAERNLLF